MKSAFYTLFFVGVFTAGGLSCAITPPPSVGDLPDRASFADNHVSKMMEMRCGSLDCHGSVGRPLRLYSGTGLRLTSTTKGPTTDDEVTENYRAVIGLEPEILTQVYATGVYTNCQLLLKPQGLERGIRHKGGQIFVASESDDGWQCLINFAAPDPAAKNQSFTDVCDKAAKFN